jgi:hypothetical protein
MIELRCKNKDKPPGPARPSPFSKSIQLEIQYGCCVRVSTFRSAPVKQNEFHSVNLKNSSKEDLPRVFFCWRQPVNLTLFRYFSASTRDFFFAGLYKQRNMFHISGLREKVLLRTTRLRLLPANVMEVVHTDISGDLHVHLRIDRIPRRRPASTRHL